MEERGWKSRSKRELIIEVWEHLDCESVGGAELTAIANELRERFGAGAVDSPARIARVLADEGAELRHAEVLDLDVHVRSSDPYASRLSEIVKLADFAQAAASISRLEHLRSEFERNNDLEGLRRLRETAIRARQRADLLSRNPKVNELKRAEKSEISEWLRVWLLQPALFPDWLDLRRRSADFRERFLDPPNN